MAFPPAPARIPRNITCLYCRGRVPVALLVPRYDTRLLASALCPQCGRRITVASRTLRRLGIPWPAAVETTDLVGVGT